MRCHPGCFLSVDFCERGDSSLEHAHFMAPPIVDPVAYCAMKKRSYRCCQLNSLLPRRVQESVCAIGGSFENSKLKGAQGWCN